MYEMSKGFRLGLMGFTTAVSTMLVLATGAAVYGIAVDGEPLGHGVLDSVAGGLTILFLGTLGTTGLANAFYLAVTGKEWD